MDDSHKFNKINKLTEEELEYLYNRYSDSFSLQETLYRIKHNIDIHPKCPICNDYIIFKNGHFLKTCGNKECSIKLNSINKEKTNIKRFGSRSPASNKEVREKINKTCLDRYGSICSLNNENVHNKMIENNKEKYGVEYFFQSNDFKEKQKSTFLDKYGNEIAAKTDIVKAKISKTLKSLDKSKVLEKRKKTCLEKYGVDYVFQYEEFKSKIKNTWLSKYGVDNPTKSKIIIESIKLHNLEKYGTTSWMQTDEGRTYFSKLIASENIQNKINNSKKQNNSFNTSKDEEELYILLKEKYSDIIRQYRSEAYPFNCDFYIPSLDLYIEYQGSWTHGEHPFDWNNQNDINKLELWKSKNTKYYNNAIETWTTRDINKRDIAKKNSLNFIEIWDISEIYTYGLL